MGGEMRAKGAARAREDAVPSRGGRKRVKNATGGVPESAREDRSERAREGEA